MQPQTPHTARPQPIEQRWLAVLRGDPDNFEALHALGLAALQAGRIAQAVNLLDRATQLRPMAGKAQVDLGIALCRQGKPAAGLQRFDRAVALMPNSAHALVNRANALCLIGEYEAAVLCSDRAIALAPDLAAAHGNRGNALEHLGRHEQALESLDRAIALAPDFADAHFNRGVALGRLGQPLAARDSYLRALAANPGLDRARWNLGACELGLGDYENGLPHYEFRTSRQRAAARRRYAAPLWTGAEDLAGRTLYVHPEGCLGDMIQYCRYLPLLEARGARVLLTAPRILHELLGTLDSRAELIDGPAEPGRFDSFIALMSLPYAFRTRLDTIPGRTGYLSADPRRIARWADRIGDGGFKVGVSWEGDRSHGDNDRFFPPASLAPLAAVPGVRLISLQKPDGAMHEAIAASGLPIEIPGDDLDAGGKAFVDTAAIMDGLDLVVACDSAVGHLAGALGRPCWLALKRVPDYRFLFEGERCPWYRDTRLFRQQSEGDWPTVFAAMAGALAGMAAAASGRP